LYRDNTCAVLNTAALHGDIDLFDHLVSRGADPSRSNALHHAALCKDSGKAIEMISHLIEKHNFDLEAEDGCGGLQELAGWAVDDPYGSPLNYAACRGNIQAMEALLKYGADPSKSLSMAMNHKQGPVVKFLLEAGAKDTESFGIAVTEDYLEGAELCLQHGADPADGEMYDKETLQIAEYDGMSADMRKLLDDWK
jgi:ankyrin repeat protein